MSNYYIGKPCKKCGGTKKENGTRECLKCREITQERMRLRDEGMKYIQPKKIWAKKLREFIEDSKVLTIGQLSEKYGMSKALVTRYLNCHKAGILQYTQNPVPKKHSIDELVSMHKDKLVCRPWC